MSNTHSFPIPTPRILDNEELTSSQVSWGPSPQGVSFYNIPYPLEVVFELVLSIKIYIIYNGYVEVNFIIIIIKYILITLLDAYF